MKGKGFVKEDVILLEGVDENLAELEHSSDEVCDNDVDVFKELWDEDD